MTPFWSMTLAGLTILGVLTGFYVFLAVYANKWCRK